MINSNNIQKLAAETGALILAAGLGSRLGSNTKDRPKCLVPVAARPILAHMIDNVSRQGIRSFTIAVGYLADHIKQFVAQNYPALDVTFVENPHYASTGSVFSLDRALDVFPSHLNLLLLEADVVLEPELAARILSPAESAEDGATLLAAYEPALSGTFALIDSGRVSAWTHESVRPKDFPLQKSLKTVNVTFIHKQKPLTALRNTVKRTIAKVGSKAPLEYAMQELVDQGMQIVAVDTRGLKWFEVDTPEDLAIAEDLFAPQTVLSSRAVHASIPSGALWPLNAGESPVCGAPLS